MSQTNKKPVVTGEITFLSKPTLTGWSHGVFKTKDGLKLNISGTALTGLKSHHPYELQGEWGQYKGEPQMKVESAIPFVEANETSLARYMMSHYAGLGRKTVELLMQRWVLEDRSMEELRQQVVYEPYRLEEWANEQPGLKRALKYKEVKGEDVQEVEQLYRSLLLQYRTNQNNEVLVTDAVLKKLSRHLLGLPLEGKLNALEHVPNLTVGAAMDKFQDNPFSPMFVVSGYGFKAADKIWRSLKKPNNDSKRLGALGWFVLSEACESGGHTFLPEGAFERALYRWDESLYLSQVVSAMAEQRVPVVIDGTSYYAEHLFNAEERVASRLKDLMLDREEPMLSLPLSTLTDLMHQLEAKKGITLDEQQKASLLGMSTSSAKVHTLTAMPGCGKTAIMEFLAQMVQFNDKSVLEIAFMAPTGKASKVLSSRVKNYGLTAQTIHAAIGWGSPLPQQINADIVVVDESSMVDLQLMDAFLMAVNPKAHIIMIGDIEQLPSVGPGHVLHDILKMPFDHHQLKEVHRNTGDILNLVKDIKRGEYNHYHGKDVMTYGLPDPESKMEKFLELYMSEVNKREGGLKKVGLLTGMRKGDINKAGWNVTYLNRALQDKFNPYGDRISGLSMREGDRIIIRKNQKFDVIDKTTKEVKQEYLANGDTGVLSSVKYSPARDKIESALVSLDDGRELELPSDILTTMDLGYALTVHQAQGSEFECAFVMMQNGQAGLFNRKLLYTGVSRAKEQLYLFADKTVLKSLVSRAGDRRFSNLISRVTQESDPDSQFNGDASDVVLFEDEPEIREAPQQQVVQNGRRPRFS